MEYLSLAGTKRKMWHLFSDGTMNVSPKQRKVIQKHTLGTSNFTMKYWLHRLMPDTGIFNIYCPVSFSVHGFCI